MVTQTSKVVSLSHLIHRLSGSGIPSIKNLIARLGSVEDYLAFVRLVREFVPDFEQEIMVKAEPADQLARFARHFEDRYFPLWPMVGDGEMESYQELLYTIPVNVMGLSDDDMGEPEQLRNGLQMMLLFIVDDNGPRAPLVNSVMNFLPESLVVRATPLSLEDLHRLLDDTDYQGVADEADVWEHSTGSYFLDADDESAGYEMIDWGREEVENLTEHWQRADQILERVYKLARWLEENPKQHFQKLLRFIHGAGDEFVVPENQLPLFTLPEEVDDEYELGDSGES